MYLHCFAQKDKWMALAFAATLVVSTPWSPASIAQDEGKSPSGKLESKGLLQKPKAFIVSDFPDLKEDCLDAIGDEDKTAEVIKELESHFGTENQPEAVKMLVSILRGSSMGPNDGWFGPARRLYDWDWLVENQEIESDNALTENTFVGPKDLFSRLDRNGDGVLTFHDFDWSNTSAYARESAIAANIFRKMDVGQDGQLSKGDLEAFFDNARGDSPELSLDAFRRALKIAAPGSGGSSGFFPGDAPTPEILVHGFFGSEIGSHSEGIYPGEQAPNFELQTEDETQKVELAKYLGEKPVVLIFGNFTCGPFRRNYPEFDQVARRYRDRAHFFGVYVREAHPDDGWMMESNSQAGVKVVQPRSFAARTKVAKTCAAKLNYSIPLLVDTMEDTVGNLYSGMPARAYVINKSGIVTYQSGRGPFGFSAPELEQALLLTLVHDSE